MSKPELSLEFYPSAKLRAVTKDVEVVDGSIEDLVREMSILMLDKGGIGLAAPQVGLERRILVVNLSRRPGDNVALINPVVTEVSDDKWFAREQCLSFPGVGVRVERPREVKLSALDINGERSELELKEWAARCVLHEIDHLNGKLLIDYCSGVKRDLIERKMRKRARRVRKAGLRR